MEDLIKKYPGTVVGVVNKNSPSFSKDFGEIIEKFKRERENWLSKTIAEKILYKITIYGDAVVCEYDDGYIVEGNIIHVFSDGLIAILDHEYGLVYCEPKYIRFVGIK